MVILVKVEKLHGGNVVTLLVEAVASTVVEVDYKLPVVLDLVI